MAIEEKTSAWVSPAYWALGVLLFINLINYLDRQVLYALLPLIKSEMLVSDTQLGLLSSAFMWVYMCAAIPVGYLADRSDRKKWISFGVFAWSFATLASGLSRTYHQLFLSRAAVGIGESCYGSVSPSFVAEYFPKEKRAGVMALFSMAIPVGSALGYIIGGSVGHHWGWRHAFYLAGIPGLVLSYSAYRLIDPRNIVNADGSQPQVSHSPTLQEYLQVGRNRSYLSSTLATAALTFGLGGFAVWMPTFFTRAWHLDVAQAGTIFGAVTLLAGITGSIAGGWIADRVYKITTKSYFLVSGVGLFLALPFGCLAVLTPNYSLAILALFIAEFCAFLNWGPLNALIVMVTETRIRSMAFAANIFVIHALGDAISPAIIGKLSDLYGLPFALLCASGTLGLAGAICLWGMRYIDHDTQVAESHA